MKRILTAAAALLITGSVVHAQPADAPEVPAEAASIIRLIGFACDEFTYETECFGEMRVGLEAAAGLEEEAKLAVWAHVRAYKLRYEYLADRIDVILEEFGVPLEDPE